MSDSLDLIGRVVSGKFKLRRCVGVGASGAVYEADQTALGRTVAVKVLKPELTVDSRIAERFHDEALLASRLNHPNTVSVIDYGATPDGLLYMVMEFLRGRTLTQILRDAGGALSVGAVLDYTAQILEGLEEAHLAGVVHADLKADNVMVEKRRSGEQVKVVDFGIAQLVGGGELTPGDTSSKVITGTPEYMAPEIIAGGQASFTSDLYSLGILIYELLAGETPFVGGAVMEVLSRHIHDSPPPLRERRSDVPEFLHQAIDRLLAKNAGDRFSTTAELKDFVRQASPTLDPASALVLCSGCGVKIADTFRFCPECGHPRLAALESRDAAAGRRTRGITESDELVERPEIIADEFAPSQKTNPGESAAQAALLPLPMVGRAAESDELFRFLTEQGRSSFLQICGASGAGKARLIIREAERAAEVGALLFVVGPDPSGLKASLYPIRTMFSGVFELPDHSADTLEAAARHACLSENDWPALLDIFGHRTELADLESSVRRRELLSSILRCLAHAADRRQAVLVFLDVDRYDRPSQELLRRLSRRDDVSEGLRVVVSNSESYASTWPDGIATVHLAELTGRALDQLEVHLLAHGSDAMPTGEDLVQRCHGNPEHIYQLTRYVLEGGEVEGAPQSLSDLIAERVELLPFEGQLLAQAAAVFGREVERHYLEVATAEHFDESGLEEALALLVARGFLVDMGDIIEFPHRLEREVIYDATPADVRRTLHDLAYTALVGSDAAELVLGHHADMAGHAHLAARLLDAAGDAAVYQLDDAGARELYHRALDCAREVLMSDPCEAHESRYIATSIKLADTLRINGETALARGVLAEARRYTQEAAALTATIDRAEAGLLAIEGWPDAAEECLLRGLETARFSRQHSLVAELFLDRATLMVRGGRPDDAIHCLTEGIHEITGGEGFAGTLGPPNTWAVVFRLAKVLASAGRNERAALIGEAALRRAERHASRVAVARVRGFLAKTYEDAGNPGRGERHRERALEELRRVGDHRATAELFSAAARQTMDLGRTGPELIREAERLAAGAGDSVDGSLDGSSRPRSRRVFAVDDES